MRFLCRLQLVLFPLLLGCSTQEEADNPTAPPFPSVVARWVDPFIGTAGEGNTFPGAIAPWGAVSISPHNIYSTPKDYIAGEAPASSGYRSGRPYLFGLGLTHLSGVGCPDLGAPVLTASVGEIKPRAADYRSAYAREAAWPGYYAVDLVDNEIRVEATATRRAGIIRFRFPAHVDDANVLIDAGQSLSWLDGEGEVRVVSPTEVEGSVETGLFCLKPNKQTVHFVIRFDRAAHASGTWLGDEVGTDATRSGGGVGAFLRFSTAEGQQITARLGISFVSIAGARLNLETEVGEREFAQVHEATFSAWDEALGRIQVTGGDASERTIFYTALYHALLHPSVASDVDGRYRVMGGGGKIGAGSTDDGYQRHTVFSLWDTYRGVHPLLTLVYPEKQTELLRSLAAMTAESGRPPLWELAGQEVNMMVGDPLIPVVADSYIKGLTDFNIDGLYATLRDAALDTSGEPPHRAGAASYWSLGYVPMEEAASVWGPVSTTLEYAFADWAMARLAERLGHPTDAKTFGDQAGTWSKLFDAETGLLRPRNKDGSWLTPFDPDAIEGSRSYRRSGGPGYVEGTAHHYAFFVPHDVTGLAQKHGGTTTFVERLQRLFDSDRFVMWNEPDMAYPYLFTYFQSEAWRTPELVRSAMARFFSAAPDGLPGNDDAGALSAWYLFSAMGFYPDCPASPRYSLGIPLFDRVEITLQPHYHAGERFVIEVNAPSTSDQQIYVSKMKLNGKLHTLHSVTHQQLTAGGTLELTLSDKRN